MALLAILAVAVMSFGYIVTSRLNAASRFVSVDRAHNAKVLNQAKQALIGWVAVNAASTDANPGRLPCPEAPAYFTDPTQHGVAAPNCTLPAAGRLPWRTLGLDRLVDDSGEPLWYVVSPGWALTNSSTPPLTTYINSDFTGQLTVDGNEAVALIIAPGPAIALQAGAGCTAWVQNRLIAGTPDLRNYLECENATSPADASFVTAAAGGNFNDQVLRVSAADLMPALEAAVADRMQREIAPALRTVYTVSGSSQWVTSSTNPMYPYAAPFANPGPGGASPSSYQGVNVVYQGLLPFNQTQGCTPGPGNERCLPSLVAYASTPADAVETLGYGYIESQSCTWESAGVRLCEGVYHEDDSEPWRPIHIQMTATFTNVAMGLRALDATRMDVEARDNGSTGPWEVVTPNDGSVATFWSPSALPATAAYTATMNDGSIAGRPRGSVTITFGATLPNIDSMGWNIYANFRIRIEGAVIGDHFLLNPATTGPGAATSWFVRNEWFRVVYYAAAQSSTANGLPSHGCNSGNCLRFNDPATRNIRALLVLAGRSLSNPAGRPNGSLTDYVEFQNAALDTYYEQRPMRMSKVAIPTLNAPWNDRLILVDWIPPNPTFPIAALP